MTKESQSWHALSKDKVFSLLETGPQGLTTEKVEERLVKFGENKLPEKKRLTRAKIFLDQFKSPLVYILFLAAGITFLLGELIDFGVILAVVFINAGVGFAQEHKAEETIASLKKAIEQKAKVIREGREHEVRMEEIVPGDILLVEPGNKVVADGRLFEANSLAAAEAALTGESVPSEKKPATLAKGITLADRENMIYQGTVIGRGKGLAVVVATGEETELGKIALMVKETEEEKTPLQEQLARFGRFLTLAVAGISILLLAAGLIQGRPFREIFITSIAVAVAAIPEGLLVALTVILAIGMQRIFKKKALVRTLIAAETLGSTTVICTDKTGTLTLGEMQVAHLWTWDQELVSVKESPEAQRLVLQISLLSNNAVIENPDEALENWKILGDPTEKALLLAGHGAGLEKEKLEKEMPRIDEIPFDADKRFMATLHQQKKDSSGGKGAVIYIKGAPEEILERSCLIDREGQPIKLTANKKKKIVQAYEKLTGKGLRVLAVGYKETKEKKLKTKDLKDFVFAGLAALKDPLRAEAEKTIKLCRKAGIRPVIVTGDHKLTARAIAQEIGLPTDPENILEGEELDKLDDESFEKVVGKISVYSRVEPRQKLRIISGLQKNNQVVAMTGDGVNDAPALKAANIGIALGSGTDVAKETADLVLLDSNFQTIVGAIREGRVIFENLRKVIVYLLSDSFTEVILIVGSILTGLPLPILAVQILWINLVEDSLPSMALAFEPEEPGVMKQPPRKKEEPILNLEMKYLVFVVGILTDLILFGLFWWVLRRTGSLSLARSITFVTLGVDTLVYAYCFKSLKQSLWHEKLWSNKFLNISVLISLVLLFASVNFPLLRLILRVDPLGSWGWSLVGLFVVIELVMVETTKWVFNRKKK